MCYFRRELDNGLAWVQTSERLSEHKPWKKKNIFKPTAHARKICTHARTHTHCSSLSAASMSLKKKKKLGLAVRKLDQHCKCYPPKNGTDICWKQILNNQNCCKSVCFFVFFFSPFSTQAPEHGTTGGDGREGVKLYKKLAYNRKKSLCTPTHKTTRPRTRHSRPGSLLRHPWSDCASWGWGGSRHYTHEPGAFFAPHTNSHSLNPPPSVTD